MTPIQLIAQVRRRLNHPLHQTPSVRQILDRAINEYRNATMTANNTGNAWSVDEFTLTALADTRRYEITAPGFSKALLVSTIPSSVPGTVEPEQALEFTQIEQLPRDWAWLADFSDWSLWAWNVSQKARYAAVFREVASTGYKNYIEIRPTPEAGEQYRVLYQVGDFSGYVTSSLDFALPFPEFDFYFTTLVADCLLPITRWSADDAADERFAKNLSGGYIKDLSRYQRTFDDFIAGLSVTDIVYAESFADHCSL